MSEGKSFRILATVTEKAWCPNDGGNKQTIGGRRPTSLSAVCINCMRELCIKLALTNNNSMATHDLFAAPCEKFNFSKSEVNVVFWLSGNALVSINEATLHQARLILGWVTMWGQVKYIIYWYETSHPGPLSLDILPFKWRFLHNSRPCYQNC